MLGMGQMIMVGMWSDDTETDPMEVRTYADWVVRQRLLTIPGVGRCTAEVISAYIDDPKRFSNGRQVSSYAGLVPVQYQSGNSDRRGRITKRGDIIKKSAK